MWMSEDNKFHTSSIYARGLIDKKQTTEKI